MCCSSVGSKPSTAGESSPSLSLPKKKRLKVEKEGFPYFQKITFWQLRHIPGFLLPTKHLGARRLETKLTVVSLHELNSLQGLGRASSIGQLTPFCLSATFLTNPASKLRLPVVTWSNVAVGRRADAEHEHKTFDLHVTDIQIASIKWWK